ncbi:MAG TPA: hypothetical protein VMH81_13960 [Bryobacteraceae bacterium]|nr:hypothetical protein [Bryobacteraceae bacterium]
MFRFALLAVLGAAAFAQDASEAFNKPPAKVDQALRARVNEFFQDHVKQEFHKAEALVAADTKEFFYSHNKPAYLSCETGKIVYSDDFKRAKVTEICEQYVMVPGFADKPLKVPFGSTWKVEKGKWCWYVDPEELKHTPFGTMTPGPRGPGGGLPAVIPENADFVMHLVQADRGEVNLKPGQPETVNIRNGAAGLMDIQVVGKSPGVEATLDHTNLKVGDRAVLTIQANEGARSGRVVIKVEPTGQIISINVSVK